MSRTYHNYDQGPILSPLTPHANTNISMQTNFLKDQKEEQKMNLLYLWNWPDKMLALDARSLVAYSNLQTIG